MGRGRAKAKQTKVARKLKYYSPTPDYSALERELGGGRSVLDEQADDEYDEYDEYADMYAPDYSREYPEDSDEKRASGEN